ncbi:MAG: hypothetical protein KAI91_04260, partial [Candidatus Omnitrophica bacterium]|nr:hypothetical protein [Candidatus Omnitrophota bacterium]
MKNLRELLCLLKPYKKKVVFAFIAILIANVLGLTFPWAIKIIIDEILIKRNTILLNALSLILILV